MSPPISGRLSINTRFSVIKMIIKTIIWVTPFIFLKFYFIALAYKYRSNSIDKTLSKIMGVYGKDVDSRTAIRPLFSLMSVWSMS